MKRINKLVIENFKFFYGKKELNFDGKNILIYGENGSGKSSLYWALYTFLQSAMKSDNEIKKYFDKNSQQSLINIYNLDKDSYIEVEIIDDNKIKQSYIISKEIINTNKEDTQILKSNLTSDFINYKLLSKIYDFKHSQNIDLWIFFYDYVLDFIPYSDEFATLKKFWDYLAKGLDKINNRYPSPKFHKQKYEKFVSQMEEFNLKLKKLLIEIENITNVLLTNNFKENIKIELKYEKVKYKEGKSLSPKILLNVKFFEKDLSKPHSFLNEARLTSIALSIRFAILKNRLVSENVLKILVLDDLLISLDMSKRFEVIDFILNDEDLQNYQKIILTHDKAFFEMAKQKFSFKSPNKWKYFEMYVDNKSSVEKPLILSHRDYFQKAEYYLIKHDYSACANYLRKEAERLLKKLVCNDLKCEDVSSLQDAINKSKHKSNFINQEKIIERVKKLVNNQQFRNFDKSRLRDEDKKIIGEVQTEIKRLEELITSEKDDLNEILIVLEQFKSIILNPQSHDDITKPLYKKELEEAIKNIKELKNIIESKIE